MIQFHLQIDNKTNKADGAFLAEVLQPYATLVSCLTDPVELHVPATLEDGVPVGDVSLIIERMPDEV